MNVSTKLPPPASDSGHPTHVPLSDAEEEDSIELLEWLGLVALDSPRISSSDSIDPYLSRYSVPTVDDDSSPETKEVVSIRWKGFLRAELARDLFALLW